MKQRNANTFDKLCPCCGVGLARCAVCAKEYPALRTDTKTCSNACRTRLKYRQARNKPARDDQQVTS